MSERPSSLPVRRVLEGVDKRPRRRPRPDTVALAPIAGDPVAHLEEHRLLYVTRLEQIAEEAKNLGDYETAARVYVNLLRFTTLGRLKVDVHSQLEKLMPEPDLSRLNDEQLDRILRGEAVELTGERDQRGPSTH
jgi:hypothetical protein